MTSAATSGFCRQRYVRVSMPPRKLGMYRKIVDYSLASFLCSLARSPFRNSVLFLLFPVAVLDCL